MFRFISQTQVAFNKSEIDDVASKLYIDNNAENAKDDAYNPSSLEVERPSKSLIKTYSLISVFAIIFLTFIIFIASLYNKPDYNKNVTPLSEGENSKKEKRTTYDNRIRFYYSLKRITKKEKINKAILNSPKIAPFTNPYPKTFNLIYNDSTLSKEANVQIKNITKTDVIVFRMIKGQDESLYIPKNTAIHIALNTSDSLLFYKGNDFIKSEFSHFRKDMAISEIYKIRKLSNTNAPTITLKPFNHSKNKVITEKQINITNNLEIRKIGIDNLYRNYYYKYAN